MPKIDTHSSTPVQAQSAHAMQASADAVEFEQRGRSRMQQALAFPSITGRSTQALDTALSLSRSTQRPRSTSTAV